MNYGLGFNSPIKLALSKENYEALIERHGQYVRWRTSVKCACVDGTSYQPDIRCKICGGTGTVYGYQKENMITATLPVDRDGAVTLSERSDGIVQNVFYKGQSIYFERYGAFLKFPGTIIDADEFVTVTSSVSQEKTIDSSELIPVGGGFFRVAGCRTATSTLDSVSYTSPGDVLLCASVSDNQKTFTILEYRLDMIRLQLTDPITGLPIPIIGTLMAQGITWLEPYKFFILSQGFSEVETKMIETVGGDAVLTAPYSCDIGDGDVITVLSGSTLAKEVLVRGLGPDDIISAFFVDSIERIFTTTHEYVQGVDFILAGTNKVVWLTATPPVQGATYSIVYKALPTYSIVKNLPSLRTSENQRMPRRAILKLFSAFKEGRRVNQND